jgi:uncharacterized protein YciI
LKTDVSSFNAALKKAGLAPLDPNKPLDPPRETTQAAGGQAAAGAPTQAQPKIDEMKMITYQVIFLKKGPKWSSDGPDLLGELADAWVRRGTILIGGAFSGDAELRGAYIVNGTPEQVKALEASDPGVKNGRYTYDVMPWFGPEGWFQKPSAPGSETIYFGFLVSGANRSQDQATAQHLQRQHLDYMDGQAKIGKLVLAGPLNAPKTNRRGLIGYREASLAAAVERASQDPMVKAGRLAVELHEWAIPRGVLK